MPFIATRAETLQCQNLGQTTLQRRVSDASNSLIVKTVDTVVLSTISFMQLRNSARPNTLPCGTSHFDGNIAQRN